MLRIHRVKPSGACLMTLIVFPTLPFFCFLKYRGLEVNKLHIPDFLDNWLSAVFSWWEDVVWVWNVWKENDFFLFLGYLQKQYQQQWANPDFWIILRQWSLFAAVGRVLEQPWQYSDHGLWLWQRQCQLWAMSDLQASLVSVWAHWWLFCWPWVGSITQGTVKIRGIEKYTKDSQLKLEFVTLQCLLKSFY